MKKSRTLIRLAVFAVLTAVFALLASKSGLWSSLDGAGRRLSWASIAGILMLIFAVLLVENLIVLLLSFLHPKNSRARTAVTITNNLLRYAAAVVILCGVLAMLSVDIGAILAGLGIIALIIGFGAESLVADLVTGIFILLDNQYNVGDIIEVGGFRGTVSQIGIRTTCITDPGGNVKIVNNSEMKNILNRSENASRAVTDFPIPYETDLAALEEKLPAMLQRIYDSNQPMMLAVPAYLGVQELGDSAVVLRFVVEVGESDIYSGQRRLNRELFLGMRELGIECPFQQVDVHTDKE